MPLCDRCERFDITNFLTSKDGYCFMTVKDVLAGDSQQCDFCSLLVEWLVDDKIADGSKWIQMELENDDRRLNNKDLNKLGQNLGIVTLVATIKESPWGGFAWPRVRLPVAADKSSPAALSGTVKGRFLGSDSSSPDTLATILEWIKDCLHNHPKCNGGTLDPDPRGFMNQQLPNRCLQITDKTTCLVETRGQTGSYLILSHRWTPQTEECSTTTSNYHERLKSVANDDLIQTFKDAIQIAIKLGIRYLWIDTLCIIQSGDDGNDTDKEILNMSQYYQNAVATICATTQMPSGSGLFIHDRELPFNRIARLPFRTANGEKKGYIYVSDRPPDWSDDFKMLVRHDKIMGRGWVFQEWFLSRRIIYFTPKGPIFECKTRLPIMETQETFVAPRSSQYKFIIHGEDRTPLVLWYYLLRLYSELSLGKVSMDRIRAMAGIAKTIRDLLAQAINQNPCCEYVSGLWLQDIHRGLLWVKFDKKDYQNVEGYPTWSWASMNNRVSWEHFYFQDRRKFQIHNALTITGLITENQEKFSVSTSDNGVPTGIISDRDQQPISIGPFDINNNLTTLKISASLTLLLIRDRIHQGEIYALTKACGLSLDSYRSKLAEVYNEQDFLPDGSDPEVWYRECEEWFKICDPDESSILSGWASIEKPGVRYQLQNRAGIFLTAIHVSTVTGIITGFHYDNPWKSPDVYNVLFVEHLGDGCYERVGVGQIFETSVTDQFDKVEKEEITLV